MAGMLCLRKMKKLICAMVGLGLLGCAQQPAEKPIPVAEMPAEIILDESEGQISVKPIAVPQSTKRIAPLHKAEVKEGPAQESEEMLPSVSMAPLPQLPEAPAAQPSLTEVDGVIPVPVAPSPTPSKMPQKVSQVEMQGKYVALTFDDGPSATLTPKVLDILAAHGAKGTFFVLGRAAYNNTSVVARAAAEGHEIGVHTWSHIKMTASSRAKIDSEISRTMAVIKEATGSAPKLMRPPYGATNKKWVSHMYNTYGLTSVLWDVDTWDWRRPGIEKVIRTAVGEAKPGSIILVHDIHPTTIEALEGIVTGLKARGFQLVTVSELIALAQQEKAAPAEPQAAGKNTPDAPAAPASEDAPKPQQWPFLKDVATPGSGAVIIRTEAPQTEPATEEASQPQSL